MGKRHTIAVAAAGLALLAPADALAKTYSGRTEQDRRVFMRISEDGATLQRLEIGWTARCEVRSSFRGATYSDNEPLTRDGGMFRFRTSYRHGINSTLFGVTSVRLAGFDGNSRSYGEWSATVSIRRRSSGREVDRCRTGGLLYKAVRTG